MHRLLPTNSTPNSVSIIQPIWPQSLCLFGPIAANPAADCDYHLPWVVGAYAAVVLPRGAQAHGRRPGLARWAKANPAVARAGGGRARAGAGVGAGAGAGVGAGARARAGDSDGDGGDGL